MAQTLPSWAAYVQALGPTLAAVAIAGFTIWIAFRQVRIAKEQAIIVREKLMHDLYDRRYAIYIAFEKMIRVLMGQKGLGDEEQVVLAANIAAHQSPFILNKDVGFYLLELNALGWRRANAKDPEFIANLKDLPPEERLQHLRRYDEDTKTILSAAPILADKFLPFLKLRDFREVE